MKKSTNNTFATILSSLLILVVVAGFVGFFFIFTDEFTTPLKNFRVSCGDNDFIGDCDNYDIVVGQEYVFKIEKNKILSNKKEKYTVNVLPNVTIETDFEFLVDGNKVKYSDIVRLNKGFDIKAYDNSFIIKANMDLPQIIEEIYYGSEVSNVPSVYNTAMPYFKLVVVSSKNEQINISFNLVYDKKENFDVIIDVRDFDNTGKVNIVPSRIVLNRENYCAYFVVECDAGYGIDDWSYLDYAFTVTSEDNSLFIVSLNSDYQLTCDDQFYINLTVCKLESE